VVLTVKHLVTRLLGTRAAASASEEPSATGGSTEAPSARLYECPDCDAVYLSTGLDSCAACHTSVESVPTERDLRYTSAGGE
jgi:hypothetical protein